MSRVYKCNKGSKCPIRDSCTSSKRGKRIFRSFTYEREKEYIKTMEETEYKKIRQMRKGMIENVFGTIRQRMGYIPLLLRGIDKISIEVFLYFIGYNITRYLNNMKRGSRFLFINIAFLCGI